MKLSCASTTDGHRSAPRRGAPMSVVVAFVVSVFGGCGACASNTTGDGTTPHPEPAGPARPDAGVKSTAATLGELTALLDRDTSLEMRGKGWYCFAVNMRTTSGSVSLSVCRRTQGACDTLRQDYTDIGMVGSCERHTSAFCLRARKRKEGVDFSLCCSSETDCQRQREVIRGNRKRYEFVTECEELD